MKKTIISIVIIGCVLLCCSSCKKDSTYKPGDSPSGLISYISGYHVVNIGGYFDGAKLDEFQSGYYNVLRKNDTTVSMGCNIEWKKMKIRIHTSDIPLSGRRDNVTFNHVSTEAEITYSGLDGTSEKEISPLNVTVSGWIKENVGKNGPSSRAGTLEAEENPDIPISENSTVQSDSNCIILPRPDFDCEINMSCVLNGKLLRVTITAIKP